SASAQTTPPCSSLKPCVKTTWTSAAVSVGADSPDGPITFALGWTQKFGTTPNGASGGTKGAGGPGGNGQSAPCTASFGTVQRAFNGAYNETTANSSRSGSIIGASVTDPANETAVTSIQSGTQKVLRVTVHTLNLGFQNATTTQQSTPTVLHTGGNQGTY